MTLTTDKPPLRHPIRRLLLTCLCFLYGYPAAHAEIKTILSEDSPPPIEEEKVFEMSLEQLMGLSTSTGSLSALPIDELPMSITTITSDDIAMSASRDLYDVIATYVPGTHFTQHLTGHIISARGISSDRPNKMLLLVNGQPVNELAAFGMVTELQHWDMDDIESVEVIRGPGSVVYGAGAVAAVINIKTKDAYTSPGLHASVRHWSDYNSQGVNLSYGHVESNYTAYFFASIVDTQGAPLIEYDSVSSTSNPNAAGAVFAGGYVGRDNFNGIPMPGRALHRHPAGLWYEDYDGNPQIKLHTELTWQDTWSFSARYTQAGIRAGSSNYSNDSRPIGVSPDPTNTSQVLYNFGGTRNTLHSFSQDFTALLKYSGDPEWLDDTHLDSRLHLRAHNRDENGGPWNFGTTLNNPTSPAEVAFIDSQLRDKDSPRYRTRYFSETELSLTNILSKDLNEHWTISGGGEIRHAWWAAPWGKSNRYFRLGDSRQILSGADSLAYNPASTSFGNTSAFNGTPANQAVFAGDGWSRTAFALLGEVINRPTDTLTLSLSARADKDEFADWFLSPRAAASWSISPKHTLKLVGQQSNRLTTAEQSYVAHRNGNQGDAETITTYELIHLWKLDDKWFLQTSAYYNHIEALGWNGTTTTKLGEQEVAGVELDLQHRSPKWVFGASYSFVDQLGWQNATGNTRNPYTVAGWTGGLQTEDNILNIPRHNIKTYLRHKATDKLTAQIDIQAYLDFAGNRDAVEFVKNRFANNASAVQTMNALLDKDVYDYDVRLNATLRYEINDHATLSIYGQNLVTLGESARLQYNWGADVPTWIYGYSVDPRAIGIKLETKF